jgi:hypothetical protein
MSAGALHAAYERALADALRADDPVAQLCEVQARSDCAAGLRRLLRAACAHPAGLRLSALLCARLRFERLTQGCSLAGRLFAADPGRFAGLFRRYHQAVAPTAHGPRAEAALFERWYAVEADPGGA